MGADAAEVNDNVLPAHKVAGDAEAVTKGPNTSHFFSLSD